MLVLYSNGFKCLNIQSELFYAKSFIKTFDRERIVENVRSDRQFNETSIVCMCVNSIVTKCKFPLLHFVFFSFAHPKIYMAMICHVKKAHCARSNNLATLVTERESEQRKKHSHTHIANIRMKWTNLYLAFKFIVSIILNIECVFCASIYS